MIIYFTEEKLMFARERNYWKRRLKPNNFIKKNFNVTKKALFPELA